MSGRVLIAKVDTRIAWLAFLLMTIVPNKWLEEVEETAQRSDRMSWLVDSPPRCDVAGPFVTWRMFFHSVNVLIIINAGCFLAVL